MSGSVGAPWSPNDAHPTATKSRTVSRFREISPDRREEFRAQGLRGRHFFAHRAYYLPKCGPDALRLSRRMCGVATPDASWEVALFATGPDRAAFPEDLYFDDDVVWHRQQFGKEGQIATAYLVEGGDRLYGTNYFADLVQRISRRREFKTQIDKRFGGWPHMLLNAILNFAVERRLRYVFSPTSDAVIAQVPADRAVERELFDRVYDRAVVSRYRAVRQGTWWVIDVTANRDRLVVPEKGEEALGGENAICLFHDVERGLGHRGIDDARARAADGLAPDALTTMLRLEAAAGVKATYNVLGCLFDDVRGEIERGGHCLAFHSYDHRVRRWWPLTRHYYRVRRALASLDGGNGHERFEDQLYRCRLVDRRVKGFRPPQSRPTAEWSDYNLVYRNFDWCATSARRAGVDRPTVQNRLVKIPIHLDDFPLYTPGTPYGEWERRAIATAERGAFVAIGLHDCYADLWLSYYAAFLEKLRGLGPLKTLDEVANETILASAV